MIVNQAFAQKFFPGEDVLARSSNQAPAAGPRGPPWRNRGVVATSSLGNATRIASGDVSACGQLNAWCCLYSVVRTSLDPISLQASVQRIVSRWTKHSCDAGSHHELN